MVPAAIIDGNKRHARFDQAPSEQTPLAETAAAVFLAEARFLAANVERLLSLARGNQTVALFVKPIDVPHGVSRGFVVDSHHAIDELPQIFAAGKATFG